LVNESGYSIKYKGGGGINRYWKKGGRNWINKLHSKGRKIAIIKINHYE